MMNAVQTVWFSKKQSVIDFASGWLSPKFHLMSWVLSSLQLAKYFDKVELVTDITGAELAVDKLQLPYTCINTALETVKNDSYLWVSNKLYSYSIQNQPFIHLDNDAYLFSQLDSQLLTAPLMAQNFEFDHDNYKQAYQDVLDYCPYVPECISKDINGSITAVNAGIIGGTDSTFFKEFTAFITNFLYQNESALSRCNYEYINVFVEQFLFKKFAEFKNVPVAYLTPIKFGPPCDYRMTEFTQLPTDVHYIHVTNYKRNLTICEQLAQRLWLESPELYERVLTVCRELEATHYPISQPPSPANPFYRTQYILRTVQPSVPPDGSPDTLLEQINALSDEAARLVLLDAFQYEQGRQDFILTLPDAATLRQDWQRWSASTNALLSLPYETYCQQAICLSKYGKRLDAEWNWAEVNEFAGQEASRDFADNLNTPPAYYETMLTVYIHQGVVREQLLDAFNILIFDALDQPATIVSVIGTVSNEVRQYQPTLHVEELTQTILGRIRHFLYHGILIVSHE